MAYGLLHTIFMLTGIKNGITNKALKFFEGLTRKQKRQYLEVLERSKTDVISPTSSTPSPGPSSNRNDAESSDSEVLSQIKKKNKKKKMVIDSEPEEGKRLYLLF